MTAELPNMSLYHLDTELMELLAFRDERHADHSVPPTEEEVEELEALDGEIRKYLEALPKKVSNVAAIFRHWDAQDAAAEKEAARIAAFRAHIKAQRERLKGYVADILDRQPQPAKGCKKLTGLDGSVLLLKGNGGLAPLKIQEDVLPNDFRTSEVRLPTSEAADVLAQFPESRLCRTEPDNQKIREALQHGEDVPGAWLEPRGVHVEIK